MNDRIDEIKVSRYLYAIAGRAGTLCGNYGKLQREPSPLRLDRQEYEPEYIKAQWLYLRLSDTELERRLEPTPENAIHTSGKPIQWDTYCKMDDRAYEREYLKSNEWKCKRDAVMQRAMQSFMPASPVIRRTVDRSGRVIKSIAQEHRPICENDGCTNDATQVHHLTYDRIGKEHLDDLQALCRKCHAG